MRDGTMAVSGGRWRRVPLVSLAAAVPALRWLRGDLVAGAVVAALAIPQALGYASIAGAPVEVGLYAVPVALVAYAIFGSSRQLVVGPVSTVSVLSGSLPGQLRGRGHGASRVVHGRAGAGLGPGAGRCRLPPHRLDGRVPLQADRHRLRPRPDHPGHPRRAAAPARACRRRRARWSSGSAPWVRESQPRRSRPGDRGRLGGLAPGPLRRPAAAPRCAVGLAGPARRPGRLGRAGSAGARRRGRRPGAARAADAGLLPSTPRPAGVARRRRGAGAGGSGGGAERCPAVRRPRRLPDRRRPGAARLRRGQPRLRSVRGLGVAGSLSKTAAVSDARGRTQMAGSPRPCCR